MIVTRKNLRSLGDVLNEHRQRNGLTLIQMAKRMGYNYPGISKIETGAMIPRLDVLLGMCETLGLEIEIRKAAK